MSAAPPLARDHAFRVAVRAAGGLVVRRGADGNPRVVLVHRPLPGGWSFPKGGQRRGESLLTTALREVRAQTGFLCVAEAVAGVAEYVDRWDRPKLVRYWAMDHVSGTFVPNDEVDAIAWLRPSEAALRLTHEHDRELLGAAIAPLDAVLELRERRQTQLLG